MSLNIKLFKGEFTLKTRTLSMDTVLNTLAKTLGARVRISFATVESAVTQTKRRKNVSPDQADGRKKMIKRLRDVDMLE